MWVARAYDVGPAGRTRSMQQLELRWYSDWRWRVAADDAGLVLWCGPAAVYWWRKSGPIAPPGQIL
jgi:hypothetical protein